MKNGINRLNHPSTCRISPPSLPCHVAEPLGRQAVAVLGHQQGQLPQQLIELDSFQASWSPGLENGPFIVSCPIKTSIYKGFSMAMLNNQMVYQPSTDDNNCQ